LKLFFEFGTKNEPLQYHIPQWFKDNTAKWFVDGKISEQEFVDVLKYMANKNLLFVI